MALYAVLMFFLAVFAGLTYKHYKVTGELLPLQWLGIESPKAALKSMTPPQAADAAQQKANSSFSAVFTSWQGYSIGRVPHPGTA